MKKTAPFIFLVLLFVAAAWYSFIKQPDPVHELPPEQPAIEIPAPVKQPAPQTGPDELTPEPIEVPDPLPLLNESDNTFKQELSELVGQDLLAQYLVKNEVISRVVVTVDSLTSRQVPAQINPVKPASGAFITEDYGESIVMSAKNFARYDAYISLLQSMSTDAVAAMYQRYYPLFQQAWEENGGEGSFNDRLLVVIDHLLETPDVSGPVYLVKPEAVHLFIDPELEAMTAGQKILVRMGNANAALVKEKLLELGARLSL